MISGKIQSAFRHRFGQEPKVIGWAPGRVEFIGNHTDLVDANFHAVAALNRGKANNNLGNGASFSVQHVIAAASRITGRSIPFEHAPRWRPCRPHWWQRQDQIRTKLAPRYPQLDAIVESAWSWHQKHPTGSPEMKSFARQ